jgi:hypothetical protein
MGIEYTVHFQRGHRVGARSLRMVHVVARDYRAAVKLARAEFADARAQGYRVVRVDHFEGGDGRLIIDY